MQPNQKGWYIILIWNPLIDLSGASNRFFVTPDFTEPISARTHTHTHTRIYIYIYIFSTSHEPHEAIFHSFIHERTKHSVRHDSRSCCCVGGNVAYCTVIVMHIYIYIWYCFAIFVRRLAISRSYKMCTQVYSTSITPDCYRRLAGWCYSYQNSRISLQTNASYLKEINKLLQTIWVGHIF